MADLDENGLVLVAGVVLPASLHEPPGDEDPHPTATVFERLAPLPALDGKIENQCEEPGKAGLLREIKYLGNLRSDAPSCVWSGVLGQGAPRRAAEEPVIDVSPLPVQIPAVADRDREACEGRAILRVAELGSSVRFPTRTTWFITASLPGRLLAAPETIPTLTGQRDAIAPSPTNAASDPTIHRRAGFAVDVKA